MLGIALAIEGEFVTALFEGECGAHAFKREARTRHCIVDVSGRSLHHYQPPASADSLGEVEELADTVRTYDMDASMVVDPIAGRTSWKPDRTPEVVGRMINQRLEHRLTAMIAT